MKNKITEILGWYGVCAILLAYALLSFEYIKSNSWAFQLLNLSGAIGMVLDGWDDKSYQSMVLNIIWGAVALIAIINFM